MINIADSNSWQYIGNFSAIAEATFDCNRSFIKPFKINTLLTSTYLAVGILVSNAKESWQDGGEIVQCFDYFNSDTKYFNPNTAFYCPKKLLVNRVTIVEMPLIANGYTITYFPNKYFKSINLELWEYQETIT